jgi:ribulose 1,5-bisphosphate synthetase/thiazole synthase
MERSYICREHNSRFSTYESISNMRASHIILSLTIKTALASRLYSNSFGVPGVNATYDYVVIGGGTAGLTIAARLAEISNVSVAVIEAGGFYQQDNGNGRWVNGGFNVQEEDSLLT